MLNSLPENTRACLIEAAKLAKPAFAKKSSKSGGGGAGGGVTQGPLGATSFSIDVHAGREAPGPSGAVQHPPAAVAYAGGPAGVPPSADLFQGALPEGAVPVGPAAATAQQLMPPPPPLGGAGGGLGVVALQVALLQPQPPLAPGSTLLPPPPALDLSGTPRGAGGGSGVAITPLPTLPSDVHSLFSGEGLLSSGGLNALLDDMGRWACGCGWVGAGGGGEGGGVCTPPAALPHDVHTPPPPLMPPLRDGSFFKGLSNDFAAGLPGEGSGRAGSGAAIAPIPLPLPLGPPPPHH